MKYPTRSTILQSALTLAEACRFRSVFTILHTIIFRLWSNIENANVYMFAV